MSSNTLTSQEMEDEKDCVVGEIPLYFDTYKAHVNPLVSNKGYTPNALLFFKKRSLSLLAIIERKPFLLMLASQDIVEPEVVSKAGSMASDGGMTNIAEFESSGEMLGLNVMQLPLFEIKSTLKAQLIKKRTQKLQPPSSQAPNVHFMEQLAPRTPFKSCSLKVRITPSIENMADELSPRQFAYVEKMCQIKTNYLMHALNRKSLYLQYVTLARQSFEFTRETSFTDNLGKLTALAANFNRPPSILPSKLYMRRNRQEDAGVGLGRDVGAHFGRAAGKLCHGLFLCAAQRDGSFGCEA
eukprot:TRINITY_DN3345_c0_g1_i1.p1 TRINITY_DN3345_c0_g1~~TRINITY_DN3345_c0_g1_i1.p1  ORF type:complete len:298 (-),score=52.26 TRINITY_DN3345_c0_g1_i1:244-1137(-)